MGHCKLGISFGRDSFLYSFPQGIPMHKSRIELFAQSLKQMASQNAESITIIEPVLATETIV